MTRPVDRFLFRSKDASLRRKLILSVELNCFAGIVIASAALFAHQVYSLRGQFAAEMTALARMVATYAVAPVSFGDSKGTTEVLGGLQVRPEITAAVLRNPEGKALALYGASASEMSAAAPMEPGFRQWDFTVVQPLELHGEKLATLQVFASFRPVFFDALKNFVPAMALALVVSFAGVAFLTRISAKVLLGGLDRLGASVARVASTADYSVRAPEAGRDEVGSLTAAFNHMLGELQAADASLRSTNASLAGEILERKRLEKALVASSRRAGMAEVATGVLHNVGNVLNSLNVSVHLVRDRLESSELKNLQKAVDLMRPHIDNPGPFFANDPKGPLVLKFVAELSVQLENERVAFLEEVQALARSVEHIKEVVSTQQNYAHTAGVIENLDGRELLEDAIRINQVSLERHGVTIEAAPLQPLPLSTDRHQVLQILVNLISNGIHALDSEPAGHRRLRISAARNTESVRFDVEDHGVGIAADNLTRIFQPGFTTRRDGHGFGLHSGAIAARTIGGSLQAHSEGLGRGARFTLIVPLSPTRLTRNQASQPTASLP